MSEINEYSYMPPEDVAPFNQSELDKVRERINNAGSSQDQNYWIDVESEMMDTEMLSMAQGLLGLSEREQWDIEWNLQRKENRQHNVSIAHGVYVNNIYRHHGIPQQPKK